MPKEPFIRNGRNNETLNNYEKNSGKPGINSSVNDDLKNLSIPELKKKPGSSPEGFTQEEAKKRLDKYGPNEIVEKKTNQFLKFLSYFWDPIPWMIEAAVFLSAIVRHWPDFGIILHKLVMWSAFLFKCHTIILKLTHTNVLIQKEQ